MSILTSATVLDLWEAGLSMTPTSRAQLLLEATGETEVDGWAVGRRDGALLQRYCTWAWAREAVVDCPTCATTLEISFDPGDVPTVLGDDAVSIELHGYAVSARTPTAGDLAGLPPGSDPETLGRLLLERCVIAASYDGEAVAVDDLPADVVTVLEDSLDDADPAADLRIPLACQECGATWSEPLDPVVFAWSAVETAARRLATEVHTLARSYGWGEQEILELSPFRRHLYLSAVEP